MPRWPKCSNPRHAARVNSLETGPLRISATRSPQRGRRLSRAEHGAPASRLRGHRRGADHHALGRGGGGAAGGAFQEDDPRRTIEGLPVVRWTAWTGVVGPTLSARSLYRFIPWSPITRSMAPATNIVPSSRGRRRESRSGPSCRLRLPFVGPRAARVAPSIPVAGGHPGRTPSRAASMGECRSEPLANLRGPHYPAVTSLRESDAGGAWMRRGRTEAPSSSTR